MTSPIKTTSSLTYPSFLRKTKQERLINAFAISALGLAWVALLCLILFS